jgi:hypothetical protein
MSSPVDARSWMMVEIHCYNCGGFISDPKLISHRLPGSLVHQRSAAIPTSALCTCKPPVVYGPPDGRSSSAAWRLN